MVPWSAFGDTFRQKSHLKEASNEADQRDSTKGRCHRREGIVAAFGLRSLFPFSLRMIRVRALGKRAIQAYLSE
jgi:hypothetical protein